MRTPGLSRVTGFPQGSDATVDSGLGAAILASTPGGDDDAGGAGLGDRSALIAAGNVWELCDYRTRDQVEVDAVLENRRGQVVAVEMEAASTVRVEDFRGLRHLRERLGGDFVVGPCCLSTVDQVTLFSVERIIKTLLDL